MAKERINGNRKNENNNRKRIKDKGKDGHGA
jgi:hypothetical protein